MKKSIIILLAFALFAGPLFAQQRPLKVLFVGYDPAKPMPEITTRFAPGMMSEAGFKAEYPLRMPAFKALLSQYFSEVKTMDCRDWKSADSEPYDVTIFDFRTKELEPKKTEKLANGQTKYTSARYLPDNFSKPVIFIASTADEMGRRIGLKLDWLCLCLDANAHHLNANHAIFKGPLEKVVPTMVMNATPEGVFHYSTGKNLPEKIPMWKVQNTGCMTSKDARIGLVARGSRFAESPDVEMISSGVCLKDVGAVALGRHGNFFLWGFGASPIDMTEEGKKVFVNTVAYMKQFNGKMPIARKYNDRMLTTDDVKEMIAGASKDSYADYVNQIKVFNEENAKQFKKLNNKKAAGEALSNNETESLQYLGREQKIQSLDEFLKGRMGNFASKFGTDTEGFQKYLTGNFGYIYCDPNAFFSYSIDEDAQQIGISNHDLKILDACVAMLKKGDRTDLALRVLKKYTWENFGTAKEWDNWLSKNRRKLFFSETNGYKFMVNTYS
jgi:hypothetical protein